MLYTSVFGVATFASTVLSHGLITSPPVRSAGDAMSKACGAAVTALEVQDPTSHVEGMPEAAAQTANFDATACNVFLCKGMQFSDNVENVQTFSPGQVVNMLATIPIPHEGPMNVSVINTKTNTAIGEPLIVFDSYADESLATLPANNTNFDVTIPSTLGTACAVAGDCVLQWFWFGTGAQQTYESCVDMVVAAGASTVAAPAPVAPVAEPVATPKATSAVAIASSTVAAVKAEPTLAVVQPVAEVAAVTPTVAPVGVCSVKTTMVTVTRKAAATSA